MIELTKLTKRFGSTTAVEGISFRVEEGETLVLLGTSGCGKTTTLKMINRLIEPSSGVIVVNGINILEQSPEILRRSIGYVLQHHGLFPHYTVAENIAVVPRLLKWDEAKIKERTILLLNKLHLDPGAILNQYPDQLSGGQQQRIGVARALAADPPVLLMDEPFGALDPITREGIKKELSTLDEFKRKTIIMVTHDVQEAFEMGDRICLMDKGTIVQIGKPSELLFNPAGVFVQEFFAAQRLLLEYKSLKLREILQDLPVYNSLEAIKTFTSPDTTLWEAMEMVTKNGTEIIFIADDTLTRKATLADLTTAFIHLKLPVHG